MGNCFAKKKNLLSERLQADIYYLQRENLRTYDYILGELESIKLMLNRNNEELIPKPYKISSV